MIGKSYDGSTLAGSHLWKPSPRHHRPDVGLIGVHELMWRNGSMEAEA